jgi:predicted adenylyl cyclase CyaB
MSKNQIPEEIEVKIRISAEALPLLREKLEAFGFRKVSPRSLEQNTLFDYPDRAIFSSGSAVRLRTYENRHVLTWKGPVRPDQELKIREEIETEISGREAAVLILGKLSLQPVFEYSKFREKLQARLEGEVEVCIDETTAGIFMEIEGSPGDIDGITSALGLSASDYVRSSYAELLSHTETGKEEEKK